MITNERQYRITNAQLEKFKATVDAFDLKKATERIGSSVLAKAELDALKSECEVLSMQLLEYQSLQSGAITELRASRLEELPIILIKARIARGMSQRELAETLGLKEQQIQRYEAEEYAAANLRRLAEVAAALGLSVSEIAELQAESDDDPMLSDCMDLPWERFPIDEMYHRNWFDGFTGTLAEAKANGKELIEHFLQSSAGSPLRTAARQRVRTGGKVNYYALIAWQCRVLHLAKRIKLEKSYSKKTITTEWLRKLAHLSTEKDGPQQAVTYLQEHGLRLIIVPHLSHTHLDGAAFLLPNQPPVIGMTLRYDRIDNFWFVLLHELIHVRHHLHRGRVESVFDEFEDDLDAIADDMENEADELAGDILIPADKWETALARYARSEDSVRDFAEELDISPAIIAGRIRTEAQNYVILRDLVGQGRVRRLFQDIQFT